MRKYLIILFALCYYQKVFGQDKILPVFDLFDDTRYSLKATISNAYEYELEFIDHQSNKTISSTLRPLTEAKFKNEFRKVMVDSLDVITSKYATDSIVELEATKAYFTIIYGSQIEQTETRYAGTLGIKKDPEIFNLNFLRLYQKVGKKWKFLEDAELTTTQKFKSIKLGRFNRIPKDSLLKLDNITQYSFKGKYDTLIGSYDHLTSQYKRVDSLEAALLQIANQIDSISQNITGTRSAIKKSQQIRSELSKPLLELSTPLRNINQFPYNELDSILRVWVISKVEFKEKLDRWKRVTNSQHLQSTIQKIEIIESEIVNANDLLIDSRKKIDQAISLRLDTSYSSDATRLDSLNSSIRYLIRDTVPVFEEKERLFSQKEILEANKNGLEILLQKLQYPTLSNLENEIGRSWTLHDSLNYYQLELSKTKRDFSAVKNNNLVLANEEKRSREDSVRNQLRVVKRAENRIIMTDFDFVSADFEFKDGFLENVTVVGKIPNIDVLTDQNDSLILQTNKDFTNTLKFRNVSPIGFTRRVDYDALSYKYLYAHDHEGQWYAMNLGTLIDDHYIEELKVGRRDFSPKNQVVRFEKSGTSSVKLEKEGRSELLKAVVFSDLGGISEDSPNGLIQTEFSRRSPLVTERISRKSIFNLPRWFQESNVPRVVNIGTLGYLDALVTLSKIENEDRSLVLNRNDKIVNGQLLKESFTSTLDLRQYENFSTELGLNALILDVPNGMTTITADWIGRYGTVALLDSTRSLSNGSIVTSNPEEYTITTFSFGPKFSARLQGDESYFFNFSFSHFWSFIRDNRLVQVANNEQYLLRNESDPSVTNEYNQVEIMAGLNEIGSNKGRIFFRYRLFWQQGFWRTTFYQAQVGYTFSLFRNSAQ